MDRHCSRLGRIGDVQTAIRNCIGRKIVLKDDKGMVLVTLAALTAIAAEYAYLLSRIEEEPVPLIASALFLGIPYLAAFLFLIATV
jgi:hypothetical protein